MRIALVVSPLFCAGAAVALAQGGAQPPVLQAHVLRPPVQIDWADDGGLTVTVPSGETVSFPPVTAGGLEFPDQGGVQLPDPAGGLSVSFPEGGTVTIPDPCAGCGSQGKPGPGGASGKRQHRPLRVQGRNLKIQSISMDPLPRRSK